MTLENPEAFFNAMRAGLLGPTLSQSEVDGCKAVLDAMEGCPLAFTAYALATVYHETKSTMLPIKEDGGPIYFTRLYDVAGTRPQTAIKYGNTCAGDGPKYAGRGYVQLTWKNNYIRATKECGVDLVNNPDLAMRPDIAAKIMRTGMSEGWFTGRALGHYLPREGAATRTQYTLARRIINGTDRAVQIADHAMKFQTALEAGDWS
jgi:hypothetical protein